MVVSLSKESESGSWLRPDLLYLLKRLRTGRECSVLCCEEEFLPKHYAEAGRTSLFKAISVLQLSPAVLKEFRMSLARRKKKAAVPAGSRSTAPGGGAGVPQRTSGQLAGKRKANELPSSGDSSEPANRLSAPSEGSAPLPTSGSAVTGELAASCSGQLGPPEGGATYAAVLEGPVVPFQPSGSLKPTTMFSDPSVPAVSSETVNSHISSGMSGPLSDTPDGTTTNAQVANTCLPAGERRNKRPIFISGFRDARAFLVWLWASCPGGLTARQQPTISEP